MSISESQIKSLLSAYGLGNGHIATDRQARSGLIHVIGNLYTQRTGQNSPLDKKYFQSGLSDGYLKKAEDVVHRNHFSRFPGSYMRLKPLADLYLSEWSQFLGMLSQSFSSSIEEGTLNERVHSFTLSHLNFSDQYLTEFSARGDTPLAVHLNFPETLKVFYSFTALFITKQPALGAQIKQLIDTSDQKIFLVLPYLVLLQSIQFPNSPYPELLKPLDGKLVNLRSCYSQLDLDEKSSLESELLDENAVFSEKAKAVHLQLKEITYNLQAGNNAQAFTRCFNTLLTELNEDFLIVETIRPQLESVVSPGDFTPDTAGALYALLHLPLKSDALFLKFLPTWKQGEPFHDKFLKGSSEFRGEVKNFLKSAKRIDLDPDFMKIAEVERDLKREKSLYRLFGILQQVFSGIKKS